MDQNPTASINLAGVQLTVSTEELFRAWLQQQVAKPVAVPGFAVPTPGVGERHVATILLPNRTGAHIYLPPHKSDRNDWNSQMQWATSVGGELPDKVESALLLATMPEEFEKEAYWLNKQHAANSNYAWYQHFGNGLQYYYGKSRKLRARVVRRQLFTY